MGYEEVNGLFFVDVDQVFDERRVREFARVGTEVVDVEGGFVGVLVEGKVAGSEEIEDVGFGLEGCWDHAGDNAFIIP